MLVLYFFFPLSLLLIFGGFFLAFTDIFFGVQTWWGAIAISIGVVILIILGIAIGTEKLDVKKKIPSI